MYSCVSRNLVSFATATVTGLGAALSGTWLSDDSAWWTSHPPTRRTSTSPAPISAGTAREGGGSRGGSLPWATGGVGVPVMVSKSFRDGAPEGGARAFEIELTERQLDVGVGAHGLGVRDLDGVADPGPEARVGLLPV